MTYYKTVEGAVRHAVALCEPSLSSSDVEILRDYLGHGEITLAIEHLAEQIGGFDIAISAEAKEKVLWAASLMPEEEAGIRHRLGF